jgi:glycosyltransferase involved in cell wall biosynthesis
MEPRGLILSAANEDDNSAYSHRLRKLAEGLRLNGIPCDFFYMPNRPPLDTVTTAALFLPFWIKELRKYHFIHCGDEEAGQAIFFCRHLLRSIVILDAHGDVVAQSALANAVRTSGRNQSASPRVRMFWRMALKAADHVLTVSKPQLNALVDSGVPFTSLSLVRNGVDLKFFRPVSTPPPAPFTFGYAGDFQFWQGIDNLIEAFARVLNPSVRLLVIGFREKDQSIKRTFRERLGERVELIDHTNRTTLIELLQSVSVLVIPRMAHPAVRHAFPTKFAEYAALGRPILVNDVDETAAFIREYKCGFVSPPSVQAMTLTMEEAAIYPMNALTEMGRCARQMAEANFSWNQIGGDYAKLVRRLVS